MDRNPANIGTPDAHYNLPDASGHFGPYGEIGRAHV